MNCTVPAPDAFDIGAAILIVAYLGPLMLLFIGGMWLSDTACLGERDPNRAAREHYNPLLARYGLWPGFNILLALTFLLDGVLSLCGLIAASRFLRQFWSAAVPAAFVAEFRAKEAS